MAKVEAAPEDNASAQTCPTIGSTNGQNKINEVPLLPGYWNRKRIPNPLLNMVMANEVVDMVSTNSERERIHDNVAKFESRPSKVGIDNR